MNRPDGDRLLAELDVAVDAFRHWGIDRDARGTSEARRLIRAVRAARRALRAVRAPVSIHPTDADLAAKLAAAARACDSALLDAAAARVGTEPLT